MFNAPFSNTRSVVELAIAEIIALARRLTEKTAAMHAGHWDKSAPAATRCVAARSASSATATSAPSCPSLAEALGMRVLFYDTADRLALGNARRCATLEELLETADVVALHVDGRPGNAGLFGAEQFAQMRPRSLFLNLSRGFAVDHVALRGTSSRAPRRRGGRRVPDRAGAPRGDRSSPTLRGLQRHPHPARRRVDRGGAAGHRQVRRREAASTSEGLDRADGQLPALSLPPRPSPAAASAPQRARCAGPASTASSPSTASTSRHQPLATRGGSATW